MQPLSFSTDWFAPKERAEAARDAYASFARIGIEPSGEGLFRSQMTALALPGLGIGKIVNSACAVSRTPAHIAGGNDDWVLFLIHEGRVKVRLKGQEEAVYEAGEAYLAPNDLPGNFLLAGIAHTQIAIPRAELERRVADPDRIFGRRLQLRATPEFAYLAQYASLLLSANATPALAGLAAAHVRDLVALILGARRDEAEAARIGGLRGARLRAVISEIEARFADPSFSAQELSARLELSERTIQDLLHETGSSLSERVLELRLQKARAMLAGEIRPRQISQIAYACGFGSVAYFNRSFRRRFGLTPTQARSEAH